MNDLEKVIENRLETIQTGIGSAVMRADFKAAATLADTYTRVLQGRDIMMGTSDDESLIRVQSATMALKRLAAMVAK
jgi:hypothetical protein